MKAENEEKLVARFPRIFRDYKGDPTQTCMAWGMTCGDGWFDLIWELCEELEKVDPDAYALQVKEKFGGLRFYVQGGAAAQEVECRYEGRSFDICEDCGGEQDVSTRGAGWVRTLCPECRAAWDKRREV